MKTKEVLTLATAFVSAMLVTGCFVPPSATEVERAIGQWLSDFGRAQVPLVVHMVSCDKPVAGQKQQCNVRFAADSKLPSLNVAIPAPAQPFPSAFDFKHEFARDFGAENPRYTVTVKTRFDGRALSAEEAGKAVGATLAAAHKSAAAYLGDAYAKGEAEMVNVQSYR